MKAALLPLVMWLLAAAGAEAAPIRITAWDYSWSQGNQVSLEKPVVIDTKPPQVSDLGAQHYLNLG